MMKEKEEAEEEDKKEPERDWINAFAGKCYICGEQGHIARECPQNKGKGDQQKGKGKGEGPCWTCNGPHMQRDCPQNQNKGKGHGKGYGKSYQKGGKKGYGKGYQYGKGKGLNAMNENYGGDYDYYDYDETSWTEAFCCLKVKEDKGSWETPKKPAKVGEKLEKAEVSIERSMFAVLETREEEMEEDILAQGNQSAIEEPKVNKKPIEKHKVRNRMIRVKRWKKVQGETEESHKKRDGKREKQEAEEKKEKRETEESQKEEKEKGETEESQKEAGRASMHGASCHLKVPTTMSRQNGTTESTENQESKAAKEGVKLIQTRDPGELNTFSQDGIWEEIKYSVDSGATESVTPEDMVKSIPATQGAACKRGVEYEVANGVSIPNEGEKRFTAVTEEGKEKNMVVQVCDVNQGLLSVSKAVAAGNRVVFDGDGRYIENKRSKERTWMRAEGGMYTIKMWVRRPF